MTVAAPRPPRRRRSLLATIAAVLLGGAATTLAVDVIAVRTDGRSLIWDYPQLASQMRQTTWGDTAIVAIAAGVALLGLLLVLAAFMPGRQKLLAVTATVPGQAAGTSRRSLKRLLGQALSDVDGVADVDVKVRRRKARLTVTSPLRNPGDLDTQVRSEAVRQLQQIGLAHPLKVKTRLRHRTND